MKLLEGAYGRPNWQASHVSDDYLMFSIPTDSWSGGEYDEDTIKLYYYQDEAKWAGRTEYDQNVKRDLDDEEIAQIVAELGLQESLDYYLD